MLRGAVQARVTQWLADRAEQERSKAQDAKACVVCLDNLRSTAILPCGHVVLCDACAREGTADGSITTCPICRGAIEQVVHVFLS